MGRRHDPKIADLAAASEEAGHLEQLMAEGYDRIVDAVDVVPLCLRDDGGCHRLYDSRKLDLLPFLSYAEQAAAVKKVGIIAATKRICSASSVLIQVSTESHLDG